MHGSAALGDFTPGPSDVDVIAVCAESLSAEEKEAIRERLLRFPDLEFHIVRRDTLDPLSEAPPFEMHLGNGRYVDGDGHAGDPDLVLHYAVLRTRGIALVGPRPSEVFAPVPRRLVLCSLARELQWALENASPSYQVLNACRAWRYLKDGAISSKTEAGAWARARVDDASIIDRALAHRRAEAYDHPDAERSRAFVRNVLLRLAHEGADGF